MPSACFDTKQHKKGEGFSMESGSAPIEESLSRMFDLKLIPSRTEPQRWTGTVSFEGPGGSLKEEFSSGRGNETGFE